MKFKFRLQSVLRQREILKDEAARDFKEAQYKFDSQVQRLTSLKERFEEIHKEAGQQRAQDGSPVQNLIVLQEFLDGQRTRIERQSQIVQGLAKILEEKRMILVEASKDQKMLEKLKEKQYQDYLEEVKKRENAEIEDIIVMRANKGVGI